MITLQQVELGVLGPLQVRQYGLPVAIPGAKPRAILTMLGLHGGSVVSAATLLELLWGDDPPRTAAKALQTHISSLRRTLGDGFVLTEGTGWTLSTTEIDAARYKVAARLGRDAIATGDAGRAVARFDEALTLWRGIPELPDGPRGASEKTRWIEGHAALVEDRADALLATGRAAEIVGELEAAIADAPLRERRWGHLMLALYRAGRQGEALGAYQRARSLLAEELGVDPGPDLRRLEAAIVAQDAALEIPVSQQLQSVTRAVTFLLTDIEGSTAAWEADADAMAVALARHDEIVEQIVTSRGGRLIKTRGEGDATFSVFDRPSAVAAAAIELQEAIHHEPWALAEPMRIRVALHTGEVELRDGDYFGRAVNRAARLRSLAAGGQILCSGATAELVIDSLSDDVVLADLGMRQLKNLARPEHVFELRLETADDSRDPTTDAPMERPGLPAVLTGPGPFVGRDPELERLLSAWQTTLATGTHAVLIAGEPGVGKTRLAGEWCRQAYEQGAVVLYGRSDEDLGAPYQPFAEALRSLVPCVGAKRLRGLRGVEALLPLVPGLTDALPDLAAPPRADPDTERYALFDAVVALLGIASTSAPVVLILDDLHWAAKPTLLLLRHLLRFGEHARVQIVGTYRSTDLDRSHPLAAMLADLHRDGSAKRLQLSGLDEGDVTTYVAEAGYDDEELARALASVTGGNPFFLIEALRHVDESGGRWDPSTLPQGVREAVSRRLSRLPAETNKALAAAAVVGSRFALALVESVVGEDLIDAFDEACKAGIVIEEPGGHYRFNHAIVRQSLLAELASVRRMRLHQKIAATLETEPGADDELLSELAYHYFECAWAGNAVKAVEYCRRAADQAMARLAYEGAADLYDKALHALEELDDELPDRADLQAELLVARCEALLAAGDVVTARGAVSQLQDAAHDSARLAAWGTCFDGQLSMLTDPERLDEIESALGAAAEKLAGLEDAAGEAKAHTVRAGCLARLGRIGDAETALDQALTAARRAGEHRRVNAVLAGAPLAALWGPNPVPRAGGRCLDVVRLLRITTGSPVVEATSTRCQGVLDAFRGRAAAGRQLIDSARRSLTELGMRHALLEVEQFAGIVELVADDPASAEQHLRRAYDGFRRMGLDADTADTAALLARACLALDRDAEADELCMESERLAGHALKASIAWRTVRAQLLARSGAHDEARRVAEKAVAVAERTDGLVDHGDACLTLATVLGAAGDRAGARAAAERALSLYELKGAAALAEKARRILGERAAPAVPVAPEPPHVELDNACVQALRRLDAAFDREAWGELEDQVAPLVTIESRRKIVGITRDDLPSDEWARAARSYRAVDAVRHRHVVVAVRGERLALTRLEIGTADVSPGAPRDELFQLFGLDDDGRIALQVFFDIEDFDAAIAELDAAHARLGDVDPRARRVGNAASRVDQCFWRYFPARDWDAMAEMLTDDFSLDDRRQVLNAGVRQGRDAEIENLKVMAGVGCKYIASTVIATRGERVALRLLRFWDEDQGPEAFLTELIGVVEIDDAERMVAHVAFDLDDWGAAFEELDARYVAGGAAEHAQTWSVFARAIAAFNRHELPEWTRDWVNIDHRRAIAIAPGDMTAYLQATLDESDLKVYIEAVHRLSNLGAVVTQAAQGVSHHGFDAEWRVINLSTVEGDLINRVEVFDESDLDAALARFDELSRPAPQLENDASRVSDRFRASFAARDWHAFAELFADDMTADDRRRVIGGGPRSGRDAEIANLRAMADLGASQMDSTVLATRGRRLVLHRTHVSDSDSRSEASFLSVSEINADNRIVSVIGFDPDDFDAAFEELDARYLAGEAAAHAHTWSIMTRAYAVLNRRGLPATTPDWVNIDHRRGAAFAPGEMTAYISAAWDDLEQEVRIHIEAVHRLSTVGAVLTQVLIGTTEEGFDAEWRTINLYTAEGDLISRCELYDEADIDAAFARFDELSGPAPRLENAASQAFERFNHHFEARDWDAMAEILAEDICHDDRRPVVGTGVIRGRDADIANIQAIADIGVAKISPTAIATRGERLALTRVHLSGRDQRPEAFHTEALGIVEINADNRIAATVVIDADDLEAAFEELDARYLAGEAAAHAHTWSVVVRANAALNQRELPATMPDYVSFDHRRGTAFAPGDLSAYIRAAWDVSQDLSNYIEAVHRLSDFGVVFTHAARGSSHEGFDAEWRVAELLTIEGELINHCELFDEADLDAALARFDELSRQAPQLENSASRAIEHFQVCFAARDWNAMAGILADDVTAEDHRRVLRAGTRDGREINIGDWRAVAETGFTNITSTVIAMRGERLALGRFLISTDNLEPEAFHNDVLGIVELNADNRVATCAMFDLDDIDAAFDELDTLYLAGEAAPHAHTWSVIARAIAAFNRRELPDFTPDWVNIDHRRAIAFAPGDQTAYIRATWDVAPNVRADIEAVHQLSNLGAVFTQAVHATSQDGFDAEWREIVLATIEGDLITRCELFDEADLGAALARFDELPRPAPRLENAASQAYERFWANFAAREWDAMAEMLGDDACTEDRRRVVNSGIRHGRDAVLAEISALIEVGLKDVTLDVIATRGDRLALTRARYSGSDERPEEAFHSDLLDLIEIDADERVAAIVAFDPDDMGSAIKELDARYLAGEAAANSHTWSVITRAFAALNRRELPATTPDWVNVDHRHGAAFEPGGFFAFIRAAWDVAPDMRRSIEVVHRLSNLGAVVSHAGYGTSREGFDAEWRNFVLVTVDGDLVNRCELFDEADLDAALARFDELSRPTPRQLENAASHVAERFLERFATGDWGAMAEILADDFSNDDRRRVVGAGVRRGRDAQIADMRVIADLSITHVTSTVIAIRGERLVLMRTRFPSGDQEPEAFLSEVLNIIEVDADYRIAAYVAFDPDDIDAAIAELDARYLAGEAAAHAHTWSVIARALAAFNRHELPEFMPDWVNIDHRRARGFAPGDLTAYIRATLDLAPDVSVYAEAVLRLSDLGAVFTQVTSGTSQDGFDAEWWEIVLATVEGDLISRIEVFDEADIDAALARFDELSRPERRLENAASQVAERFWASFAARDWGAMAEMLADDICHDDRRPVVGTGVIRGRDADIANIRAIADIGVTKITPTITATRGERLALTRVHLSGRDQRPEAFHTEAVGIVELNVDNRIAAMVVFDLDDIDAPFAELDARYLAGEAANYSQTWSIVAGAFAALARHEIPPTTPDWVNIDHRRGRAFAPGELFAFLRAAWEVTPDLSIYMETVHRLDNLGAVVTHRAYGTSQEGFDAEWRTIELLTFEGDLINRCEMYDEADLDAALARFDELSRSTHTLENAATRTWGRLVDAFNRRDVDDFVALTRSAGRLDDRRTGVRDVQDGSMRLRVVQTLFEYPKSWRLEVEHVAIRGSRLCLTRQTLRDTDEADRPITIDLLTVLEVGEDNLAHDFVNFDPDDINGAFAELDARYLAGEAATHAHTWSVITGGYAALKRHELPPTTPDWVNIDHRQGTAFAPGEMTAYIRAAWDLEQYVNIYIEAVHRLTHLGAVVTFAVYATSREGFDAEWRTINLVTVEGDLINRSEMFDEAEIDAALARFDELRRRVLPLENSATRTWARLADAFNRRDVDGFLALTRPDGHLDDRRKGLRAIYEGPARRRAVHAFFDAPPSSWRMEVEPIAIRGSRLSLTRERYRDTDDVNRPIVVELLTVMEVGDDDLVHDTVDLDPDDIDAAFAELDAQYVAGEAASHAHAWSVIVRAYAALNRHELPATMPDFVDVDHRRGAAFAPGDLKAFIRAVWDVAPVISSYIEAVQQLNNRGAIVTQVTNGTSHEGFDAEWREINLLTVDGDLINRCELFDEADLDAALARFEELSPPAPKLDNAATRGRARVVDAFNRRDLDGFLACASADGRYEDRRKGLRDEGPLGPRFERAVFETLPSWRLDIEPIAVRGDRLALSRETFRDTREAERPVTVELMTLMEVADDELVYRAVFFDPDDINGAIGELTARWIASGEVAHPEIIEAARELFEVTNGHDWDALARREAGATYVNHRQLASEDSETIVDHWSSIRTMASLIPDMWVELAEILTHSAIGLVTNIVVKGTTAEGAAIELPAVILLLFDGDRVTRMEAFDLDQRDAALARFEELNRPT